MKKEPLKILKGVFLLPVKPLLFIISCYVLYLVYKNSNYVDFDMFLDKVNANKHEENYSIEQDLPTDLAEYMKSVAKITRPFLYAISLGLWYWIITAFIL